MLKRRWADYSAAGAILLVRADGGVGSPDDMLDKARFQVDVKHASAWWHKIALVDHCVARLPLDHRKTKKDQAACEI